MPFFAQTKRKFQWRRITRKTVNRVLALNSRTELVIAHSCSVISFLAFQRGWFHEWELAGLVGRSCCVSMAEWTRKLLSQNSIWQLGVGKCAQCLPLPRASLSHCSTNAPTFLASTLFTLLCHLNSYNVCFSHFLGLSAIEGPFTWLLGTSECFRKLRTDCSECIIIAASKMATTSYLSWCFSHWYR